MRARAGELVGIAAALALVVSPACERGPAQREAGRPIRVALYASPQSLDPHRYSEFLTFAVLANAYESLVELDRELKIGPALAERWENPDERTWRFRLRRGVRFHDGRRLRAADVVYSLQRARAVEGGTFASYLTGVVTIRASDELTVELVTEGAVTVLLSKLALVHIVPEGYSGGSGPSVGTGPYRLSVPQGGEGILLQAFDGYWGARPPTPEVHLVPILDPGERRRQLFSDEVDLLWDVPPDEAKRIGAETCCRILSRPSLTVELLRLHVARPPFTDPRVRRAVSVALDREGLVRDTWLGYAAPANQFVGPNVLGFAPDLTPIRRDVPLARRLLAEAGYASGLDLDLEFREGRRAEPIRDQLAEAGIRVRLKPAPWRELLPRLLGGTVPFYLGALVADSGDASDVLLSSLTTRDPAVGMGAGNYSGYSNPELDRLLVEADRVSGVAARRRLLQRAMAIAVEELPMIPLTIPHDVYAIRRDIHWTPRADGRVLAAELRREEAAPR